MTKFKSIALWEKIGSQVNVETTDTHNTRGQAESVCRMLERDGFGGEGKMFPIKTRVEEVDE